MKFVLSTVSIVALAGCAASSPPKPPTALLQGLVGQTCLYRTSANEVRYTVRNQGGVWAVHDVFGRPGIKPHDGGWMPGTVNGSTVSFPGVTVERIDLTATGPHSATSFVSNGSYSNSFNFLCAPAKGG